MMEVAFHGEGVVEKRTWPRMFVVITIAFLAIGTTLIGAKIQIVGRAANWVIGIDIPNTIHRKAIGFIEIRPKGPSFIGMVADNLMQGGF
jgi:hypothetical protein